MTESRFSDTTGEDLGSQFLEKLKRVDTLKHLANDWIHLNQSDHFLSKTGQTSSQDGLNCAKLQQLAGASKNSNFAYIPLM